MYYFLKSYTLHVQTRKQSCKVSRNSKKHNYDECGEVLILNACWPRGKCIKLYCNTSVMSAVVCYELVIKFCSNKVKRLYCTQGQRIEHVSGNTYHHALHDCRLITISRTHYVNLFCKLCGEY